MGVDVPRSHFGAPRGARGWIAGQVVSRLTAEANRWMVARLEVEPGDRVLDVGCGPGVGLKIASEAATGGLVTGVDPSPIMVAQARRRNRRAMREGRVTLVGAGAAALPFADGRFDKVWSLNSMQFWAAPEVGMRELRRVVADGGRVVVGLMARSDDPPSGAPPAWIRHVGRVMEDADLGKVISERQTFGGVVHWALLARGAATTAALHSRGEATGD